ncbi:MAG: cupin domain-containing protein [Candidatus Aenigmarchaeota archaeon]|nr:cupin domain-containing protein [Candidatus Aenigmarchaeota archaeon]
MAEIMYGDVKKGGLFENWGELGISATLHEIFEKFDYKLSKGEALCIVQVGKGHVKFNSKSYQISEGCVWKSFAGQEFEIQGDMSLLIIEMRNSGLAEGEDIEELKIVDMSKVPAKVYEYETLGQEIIKPKYTPGIGLLRFTFPIDRIPIHRHPFSGRMIIPVSGKGYTYVEPHRYEIEPGKFTLFPKTTTHTNGPIPGEVLTLLAVQLPWVDSKIDEENIAGHEDFVRYLESTPPKQLWKKKEDLERAAKRGVNK